MMHRFTPISFGLEVNSWLYYQCDAIAARLYVRWRYRKKLKVRFLSPHQASIQASPILLVVFSHQVIQ
jgi:hypothetical protein